MSKEPLTFFRYLCSTILCRLSASRLPRGRPAGRDALAGEDLLVTGSPVVELLLDGRLVDLSDKPCDSGKEAPLTISLESPSKRRHRWMNRLTAGIACPFHLPLRSWNGSRRRLTSASSGFRRICSTAPPAARHLG